MHSKFEERKKEKEKKKHAQKLTRSNKRCFTMFYYPFFVCLFFVLSCVAQQHRLSGCDKNVPYRCSDNTIIVINNISVIFSFIIENFVVVVVVVVVINSISNCNFIYY